MENPTKRFKSETNITHEHKHQDDAVFASIEGNGDNYIPAKDGISDNPEGIMNLEDTEENQEEPEEEEEDILDINILEDSETKNTNLRAKKLCKEIQSLLFGFQSEQSPTREEEDNNCKQEHPQSEMETNKNNLVDVDEYIQCENGDLVRLCIPKYLFEKIKEKRRGTKDESVDTMRSGEGKIIFGIDEAGRGPVLGPMVYGAAFWHSDDNKELEEIGFNDSKVLNANTRYELAKKMIQSNKIGWVSHSLSARSISQDMLARNPINLNELSFAAASGMISKVLEKGLKVDEAYIDTVGPPDSYRRKFESHFHYLTNTTTSDHHQGIEFTVAKKADSLYPVTSAASIVAKVTRDISMKLWSWTEKAKFNPDLGSGYPADPKTSQWLKENTNFIFGLPDIARFSWATTKELMAENCANMEWEADEEIVSVDPALIGVKRIDSLFGRASAAKKKAAEEKKWLKRCDYMIQKIGMDIEYD